MAHATRMNAPRFLFGDNQNSTIRQHVEAALGEWGGSFDVNGIESEVRSILDAALPDGWMLIGDDLYVTLPATEAQLSRAAEAAGEVTGMFWDIVKRHDAAA